MKEFKRIDVKRLLGSGLAVLTMLSFASPAGATLLRGYASSVDFSQPGNSSARDSETAARPDSFPPQVQGAWHSVTVVVDSLVEGIPVGQQVVSRVDFVKDEQGRVLAHFQQPGWTEAQASVSAYSPTHYQMEKTNYYYAGNVNGAWAARSRDKYQLLGQNQMLAESEIDQYVGGAYVGRYHTRSRMFRMDSGMENVALQRVPDPDDQSGDLKPGF